MVATEQLIRQGYRNQRLKLDVDAKATVARLAAAYERFLATIAADLQRFEALTDGAITLSELRRSSALQRLQQRLITGLIPLQNLTNREAERLQQAGIADGRALGVEILALTLDQRFVRPPLEQIAALIDYIDTPAFQAKIQSLGQFHAQHLDDILIADEAQGRNPMQTARHITTYLRGAGVAFAMPLADAVRMTRTVQLYSARRGTQAMYQANRDVVPGWYWSCARDIRTCPACWAQHGTFHPLEELLNDHHNGRCALIPGTSLVTPPRLGTELFGELSTSDQRQILGQSAYAAWRDGAFELSQIVGLYQDDVFGLMIRERPLEDIIGIEAARVYRRNAA